MAEGGPTKENWDDKFDTGSAKPGDIDVKLKAFIETINRNPRYKIVTTEEYSDLLAQKNTSTSTPKPKLKPPLFKFDASKFGGTSFHTGHNDSEIYTFNTPTKLPIFFGNEDFKKDDITNDVWSFEVKYLQNSHVHVPEHIL